MSKAIALAQLVALGAVLVFAVAATSAHGALLRPCTPKLGQFCPRPQPCAPWQQGACKP